MPLKVMPGLTLQRPLVHDSHCVCHHIICSSKVADMFDQVHRHVIEGAPVVGHFARHHDVLGDGNALLQPFFIVAVVGIKLYIIPVLRSMIPSHNFSVYPTTTCSLCKGNDTYNYD